MLNCIDLIEKSAACLNQKEPGPETAQGGRSGRTGRSREDRRRIYEEAEDAPASDEKRPPFEELKAELSAIRTRGYDRRQLATGSSQGAVDPATAGSTSCWTGKAS